MTRIGVVTFPGTLDDRDASRAAARISSVTGPSTSSSNRLP